MYFAVIGKNKELTLKELEKIQNKKEINENIITFELPEDEGEEYLRNSGSIIKRWYILHHDQLAIALEWTKILWCNKKEFAIKLKKKLKIKRFKITTVINTDREVKNKWKELIKIGNFYGVVEGYQNIPLYEQIDFEKPSRSMQMWMMPAKLTHIMLNIWLNIQKNNQNTVIYDPFVGSGTTGFLANNFWINFVGSDIKTQYFAQNLDRRKNQENFKQENFIQIFTQDIYKKIEQENIEKFGEENKNEKRNILIISEWRLWPIVGNNTTLHSIEKHKKQVSDLYKIFLIRISETFWNIPMVFTIPWYLKNKEIQNTLDQEIKKLSETLERKYNEVEEVYAREKQFVGRKIIILN